MTVSGLYVGKVVHQRHRPREHRFEYDVFSLLLDLDELLYLDRFLRLFGHNRTALFSLFDRDHGTGDGTDLKRHVLSHLSKAGINDVDGAVRLLCYPRMLGFVFNPLSVFYCYDKTECLKAVVYEVHNTHGERHSYVIPVATDRKPIRHSCDKVFFVSPFMPMNCRYRFHINQPGERLHLFIHETHEGKPILDAWFTGRREPLSDGALLQAALRFPPQTLKVFFGIHWEALKLWRKGLPILNHSPAPKYGASFIDP